MKDAFSDLQSFHFVIVLPSETSSSREDCDCSGSGAIVAISKFRNRHDSTRLSPMNSRNAFDGEAPALNRDWLYDEYCLVCTFMMKSLQSVQFFSLRRKRRTNCHGDRKTVEAKAKPFDDRRKACGE
jgi:hypothetical protein